MSILVHNISGSPMGWRVLLGFAFKGVDYEVNYLNGSEREHKQPRYLAINPHGKVPAVEYNGEIFLESLSILGLLDNWFPERPLFGSSPDSMKRIWRTTTRHSDYLLNATNAVVFPVFNGSEGEPKLDPADPNQIARASKLLKTELAVLEQLLQNGAFLCGEEPSAADAVAFPDVARVMRAWETKPASMKLFGIENFHEMFPLLSAWQGRISVLEGVASTRPPHWK
ncbi:glutathione S-transferase family protein [uncultured Roseibium sp.]|uniref:glutathione S-transferase family protein n=1 Tax=uncultured Roseibium sp. TaxID=1936171 RepID=UPI0026232E1D|nr:glutathione S-transferase family protein [uncultured Roseibium sp.]